MKARVNLSLDQIILDKARIKASEKGIKLSQYISLLIYNDLNSIITYDTKDKFTKDINNKENIMDDIAEEFVDNLLGNL